jgi:hypothetical protein
MIQRHYTRKAVEKYKPLWREEKTIHKKNKRIFQENILKEIEEFNLHNVTRRLYRMVNKMRKEFKPRISAR